MKRIRITHVAEYHYHTPVTFGPHRALVRPREGHDLHIDRSRLTIEPAAHVRWVRDVCSIRTFTRHFSTVVVKNRECSFPARRSPSVRGRVAISRCS